MDILDRFNGGIICLQKSLGLDIKFPPGIRKNNGVIVTIKQADIQLVFQAADFRLIEVWVICSLSAALVKFRHSARLIKHFIFSKFISSLLCGHLFSA